MDKTFIEMTNKELFCVLAGDQGIMAQKFLRDVINDYYKRNPNQDTDLHTMVEVYLQQHEDQRTN